MKINLYNYFIILIIISNIHSIIIIPFKSYNPLLTKDEKVLELIKKSSDIDLVNTLSKNLIYTDLKIGENIQNISAFIEMRTNEFIIKNIFLPKPKEGKRIVNSNFTYNDNYILKNIINFKYYNSNKSLSYKHESICYDYSITYFPIQNTCADEIINLIYKNNINDKIKDTKIEFPFVFRGFEDFDHRTGILGFNHGNKFIPLLKQKSEINNYDFTIQYTDILEEKGEIIIGDLPHIYDEINYSENDIRMTKVIKKSATNNEWNININTYIKLKNNSEYLLAKNENAVFYIEEFFITAGNKYYSFIQDNFFKKYIELNKCRINTHTKGFFPVNLYYIMCYIENENERKEFFDSFPPLIIYQNDMNFNFTLDANDLFTIIPDNNRILFNVDFEYFSSKWSIGKPFFKKFQLFFNSDSNLINYYIKKGTNNKKEILTDKDSNNKEIWKILLIIILAFFIFFIGFIFGRVLCSKYNRKMRANELEDKFSYIPEKIEEKNENKDNLIDKIPNKNYKSKYYNLISK